MTELILSESGFRVNQTGAFDAAATFEISSSANSSPALDVSTSGMGAGVFVTLDNPSNGNAALTVLTSGAGPAALLVSNNPSPGPPALIVQSHGSNFAAHLISSTNQNALMTVGNVTINGQLLAGDTTVGQLTAGAAAFGGNLFVSGELSKASGSFKIDHPLEPGTKYLYHSFVESPDMKNVYDGVVLLDDRGRATVALPPYFEALNRDVRYQLTSLGAPAPDLHVAEEVANNVFQIAGGRPNGKVSWQVTGIRKDAFARAHPIVPEVPKEPANVGRYLHPRELGKSDSLKIR